MGETAFADLSALGEQPQARAFFRRGLSVACLDLRGVLLRDGRRDRRTGWWDDALLLPLLDRLRLEQLDDGDFDDEGDRFLFLPIVSCLCDLVSECR